jgi:hypothetical protein
MQASGFIYFQWMHNLKILQYLKNIKFIFENDLTKYFDNVTIKLPNKFGGCNIWKLKETDLLGL